MKALQISLFVRTLVFVCANTWTHSEMTPLCSMVVVLEIINHPDIKVGNV